MVMQSVPLASVETLSTPSLAKAVATRYVPVPANATHDRELSNSRPSVGEGTKEKAVINFPPSSMNTHHPHVPIQPTTREAIHQTIAARAYELWEKYRRPENQALDHWLEAERELMRGPRRRHSNPPHAASPQKREDSGG